MTVMTSTLDTELEALKVVIGALARLDVKQRAWVIKTSMDRFGETLPQSAGPETTGPSDGNQSGPQPAATVDSTQAKTPKQFLKEKNPVTEPQRIACLAYYLTHNRKQQFFKTEDLTKLNSDAALSKFSNPSMVVANATRQNKFLAAGSHGTKQITTLGEEVVDALPNQEAVKAVLKKNRR